MKVLKKVGIVVYVRKQTKTYKENGLSEDQRN